MSTNYYVEEKERCPHCNQPTGSVERIHLGKQSVGWKFVFRSSDWYWTFPDFINYIKDKYIVDEYGLEIEPIDLIEKIVMNQIGDSHVEYFTNELRVQDGYEFLDCEFS